MTVIDQPTTLTASDSESVPAELVPATVQPERSAGNALEAATQHVLDNPGVAGRDEFLSLAAQARMLHLSGAAPKLVREDPYIAFHVAMAGRDLGLSPTAALELIDVINTGSGPQLSLSPQLRLAQVRKKGLGNIRPKERSPLRCVALVIGPDGQELGESVFTWEDAQMAGLVMADCLPGQHTARCQNRQSSSWQRCNQGYVTYPQRMLWWRAVGYGCDDFFPEASLGLYSAEELGAVVDAEGRPVDPSTAELPPGYADPNAARAAQQAERDAPADADDIALLMDRIKALPEELRKELGEAWHREGSRLQGQPVQTLPARLVRAANALVNGYWTKAQQAGADPDAELDRLRAARQDVEPAGDGEEGDTLPADPEFHDGDPEDEDPPQGPGAAPSLIDVHDAGKRAFASDYAEAGRGYKKLVLTRLRHAATYLVTHGEATSLRDCTTDQLAHVYGFLAAVEQGDVTYTHDALNDKAGVTFTTPTGEHTVLWQDFEPAPDLSGGNG